MSMSGAGLGSHASHAVNQSLGHDMRRDNVWVGLLWTLVALMILMLLGVSITAGIFWWSWQLERERADTVLKDRQVHFEQLAREVKELKEAKDRMGASLTVLERRQLEGDLQCCRVMVKPLQAQAARTATFDFILDKIEKHCGRGAIDQWNAADRDRYIMYDRLRCEEAQAFNNSLSTFLQLRQGLLDSGLESSKVPEAMAYLSTQPRGLVLFP